MDDSEQIAKRVVEKILEGATMEFQSDQSHSECDFILTYLDGRKAAVEVTTSTGEESRRTLHKLSKHRDPVVASACSADRGIVSIVVPIDLC